MLSTPDAASFRFFPWTKSLRSPVLAIILMLVTAAPALAQTAPAFPLYPCIAENVRFWEDIYGKYTTRQAVIHDANNLGRIYSVLELTDPKFPWASWLNSERIQTEKKRILHLLTDLASANPPRNKEALRIARLFPNKSPKHYRAACDSIRMQLGQKDRFFEGVRRSTQYIQRFKLIFIQQGLPPELAYLPHVESSFQVHAQSKAGAAGLWQFTQATGQRYLMITPQVDERFDPLRATRAAAVFLKENYAALGSWPLALTAYNYGRAGMLRAVRQHGSYPQIFLAYDQGFFKFASRNFYSEFLAAVRVAQRLEKSMPQIPASLVRQEGYRLTVATSLQQMLLHTGLSKDTFIQLNPALRPSVLSGIQPAPPGYTVRIRSSPETKSARIAPPKKTRQAHIKLQEGRTR